MTVADALRHPTWSMGDKITIDSATMANKGLELIEARWLFDVEPQRIEAMIHPQSIIHSLVEFVDGSQIAQMSWPDMRLPIQLALTYPDRLPNEHRKLDLASVGSLEFAPLEDDRFPAFRLAREAAIAGGSYPTAYSIADELAVAAFLRGEIGFTDIAQYARNLAGSASSSGCFDPGRRARRSPSRTCATQQQSSRRSLQPVRDDHRRDRGHTFPSKRPGTLSQGRSGSRHIVDQDHLIRKVDTGPHGKGIDQVQRSL